MHSTAIIVRPDQFDRLGPFFLLGLLFVGHHQRQVIVIGDSQITFTNSAIDVAGTGIVMNNVSDVLSKATTFSNFDITAATGIDMNTVTGVTTTFSDLNIIAATTGVQMNNVTVGTTTFSDLNIDVAAGTTAPAFISTNGGTIAVDGLMKWRTFCQKFSDCDCAYLIERAFLKTRLSINTLTFC